MRTRITTALLISAVLLVGSGSGPAGAAADPTYPTGTFSWDATTKYLNEDLQYYDRDPSVVFRLRATSLSDDTTPARDLVVKISKGSFRFAPIFADTTGTFTVELDSLGTHLFRAEITDTDGHATVVDLPALTTIRDSVAPVTKLTFPKPALRHRIAGWRVLRGTQVDDGVGPGGVEYQVMQKRGKYWYWWSQRYPHRWVKGKRTLAATRADDDNGRYAERQDDVTGDWRTFAVEGLRRGTLVVCIRGEDSNGNTVPFRCTTERITRR